MTRLRFLPIVLFATSALLGLKLTGFVVGAGSFGGPHAAAAESATAEHGASAAAPTEDFFGSPLDLAAEAAALRKLEAASTEDGQTEHGTEPSDAPAHDGEAAEAALPHGEDTSKSTEPPVVEPAGSEHGAEPVSSEEPSAGHAAPTDHAPAAGEHGNGEPLGVTTIRPKEYIPPDASAESQLLQRLSDRRKELDSRESDITMRMKLLEAAEAKLQTRIDELKALEAQLAGSSGQEPGVGSAEEDEKLKGLVSMYETMKPKAAARVFNSLELPILLTVSRGMEPRKMSAVLALMDPEKAAMLTTAMAGTQRSREIIIRREEADYAVPGADESGLNPDDLPQIMPAEPLVLPAG